MLRLPDNPNVKKMFHWAHNRTLFTLTIYHGPAALLAAGAGNSFIYNKIPNCDFIRRNLQTNTNGWIFAQTHAVVFFRDTECFCGVTDQHKARCKLPP
jgi:putative intracellular protease/amidase